MKSLIINNEFYLIIGNRRFDNKVLHYIDKVLPILVSEHYIIFDFLIYFILFFVITIIRNVLNSILRKYSFSLPNQE